MKGVNIILLAALASMATCQLTIAPSPTVEGRSGEMVNITCSIATQLGSVTLEMLSGGVTTTVGDGMAQRIEQPNLNRVLYIFGPLTPEDNGAMFQCALTSTLSTTITLYVLSAPDLTLIGQSPFVVTEGDQVTITASFVGNPAPNFTVTGPGSSAPIPSVNGNFTLVFDPVSRANSGNYTITANNSIGMDTIEFTLDVQFPPTFEAEIYSGQFVCDTSGPIMCASMVGGSGSLNCMVSGNPTPEVDNSTNASYVENVVTNESGFSITSAVAGNTGRYVCSAMNSLATEVRTFYFFVGDIPAGVYEVNSVSSNDEVAVEISWVHDNSGNNVPVGGFTITLTLQGGSEEGGMVVGQWNVSGNDTSFTIPAESLEPESLYSFSVRPFNLLGNSERALEGQFATPTAPTMAPTTTEGAAGLTASLLLVALLLVSIVTLS